MPRVNSIGRAILLLVPALMAASASHYAASQENQSTERIYVPNVTGDVPEKLGEVLASAVSAELMRYGAESYTYRNLADQLKEEKNKEILQCDEDTKCVNEIVASFGLAKRLFIHVSKIGDNKYYVELTFMYRDRLLQKVVKEIVCPESDLIKNIPPLAVQAVGLKSPVVNNPGNANPGPGNTSPGPQTGPEEFLVQFESVPPGALVEIDGVPKSKTPYGAYLTPGNYRVRMVKEQFDPKEELVQIDAAVGASIKWTLVPAVGWLDIQSEPPGMAYAIVRAGAVVREGRCPVSQLALEPGTYSVEPRDSSYHDDRVSVTISKGEKASTKLTPRVKEGFVKIKTFDENGSALPAEVKVAGKPIGKVPGPFKMKVGVVEVTLLAEGYAPARQQVTVELDRTVEVAVTLKSLGGVHPGSDDPPTYGPVNAGAGFVLVRSGCFVMGIESPTSLILLPESPPHEVCITRSFLIQSTEVSQAQFTSLFDVNPSHFKECGGDCPVEQVTWFEALAYANALSHAEGLPQCYSLQDCSRSPGDRLVCDRVQFVGLECEGYRLPTEAEWEYAARAGTHTEIPGGELDHKSICDSKTLDLAAWYCGNSGVSYEGGTECDGWEEPQYEADVCGTHPVGKKAPNPWGLMDMSGNVWEWVWDWAGAYGASSVKDPTGPYSGNGRVIRGGSWAAEVDWCTTHHREAQSPDFTDSSLGFRVVRTVK